LFVVAAPSGAGKTSLVKALLERESTLRVCISHTTRPRRPHEMDGRHYFFTSVEEFRAMIAREAFIEHASVFDHLYGTSRAALEAAFGAGHDVILEIDWQGARQVRERVPQCITIFILPPSRVVLEQRLRDRRTDSEPVIARRLRDAVDDMAHYGEFDYVVVNDQFDVAVEDLQRIIAGDAKNLGATRPALQALTHALLAPG
jgi:guanylate kinase